MSRYMDRKGRMWLLVAHTAGGIYAWFRPMQHADDGFYDKNFKLSAMQKVAS